MKEPSILSKKVRPKRKLLLWSSFSRWVSVLATERRQRHHETCLYLSQDQCGDYWVVEKAEDQSQENSSSLQWKVRKRKTFAPQHGKRPTLFRHPTHWIVNFPLFTRTRRAVLTRWNESRTKSHRCPSCTSCLSQEPATTTFLQETQPALLPEKYTESQVFFVQIESCILRDSRIQDSIWTKMNFNILCPVRNHVLCSLSVLLFWENPKCSFLRLSKKATHKEFQSISGATCCLIFAVHSP